MTPVKYVSAVPAIRTPFGVDVFDYAVLHDADVRPGDLIRIPFRKKQIPALILSVHAESDFAKKAIEIGDISHVVRFLPTIIPLLDRASERAFVSRPSVLHSWLRRIPARLPETAICEPATMETRGGIDVSRFSPDPFREILTLGKRAGRTLILTPWQSRAEAFGRHLGCPVLHAKVPYAEAWRTWASWMASSGTLVTTRVGAWLAHAASAVIIDEPENDDHKEDEQDPRLDARWIVRMVNEYRPSLPVIRIGRTPQLSDAEAVWEHVPTVDADISYDPRQKNGASDIPRLSAATALAIDDAVQQKQPVAVIDPFRDREFHAGFRARYPDVPILDLPTLHQRGIPKRSLIVLTDIAGIGGTTEDIRKRERNVIAWRRLCSTVALTGCHLRVQGDEAHLEEARRWLAAEGVKKAWDEERASRMSFAYPPERTRIKIIVIGSEPKAGNILNDLEARLPKTWAAEGLYPVDLPESRQKRWIIHIVSQDAANNAGEISDILRSMAREVLIDLDPIAFFR